MLARRFTEHEEECRRLLERRLPLPAYDQVLKCSHTLNLLEARGAISVTERAAYIGRVRNLARAVAQLYWSWRAMQRCCLRSAARSCPPRACREAERAAARRSSSASSACCRIACSSALGASRC